MPPDLPRFHGLTPEGCCAPALADMRVLGRTELSSGCTSFRLIRTPHPTMSPWLQRQDPETVRQELGHPELHEVGSTVGTQGLERPGSGRQAAVPRNDTWDWEAIVVEDHPVVR